MVSHESPSIDFSAIKARQQITWSMGDFSLIGSRHVIVSEQLCETTDVHADERVLDIATGSGNTALAAARRFCEVIGIDYVPALLEDGRKRAVAEHLNVTFQEGDSEHIPFADASFDVILSTFGIMFAPRQEQAASEVLRVCRSGGRIGLANWTPSGYLGEFFRLIGKYVPPPSGLKPPVLWGTEERLRELFGDGIVSLQTTKRDCIFRYRSASHWLDHFATYLGPMITTLAALDATGQRQLSREVIALLESYNHAKDGTLAVHSEYLEAIAVRR